MRSKIVYLIYAILLIILLFSVVHFGYKYQFNADEVFNANSIYLMVKGYKPYVDFYTVYSPILHWVLTPVFLIFGFNFEAIGVARIVMIGFFIIRLILMYLLVKKVFGKRAGLIFVPLYLMSPFAVFSEMQIRSDNVMMLIYIIFLLVLYSALLSWNISKFKDQSSKLNLKSKYLNLLFLTSGILFALTFITNIKIFPSLGAVAIVLTYWSLMNKQLSKLLLFINGFCLTLLIFFGYFFINGYVGEMFLHVFLDGVRLNNSIPHPTWLGYFYFTNPTIYGVDGKSINWVFTWMLPILAFAGAYGSIISLNGYRYGSSYSQSVVVKRSNDTSSDTVKLLTIILVSSLFLQWASMLFINSVFLQYYIPLNWLYALFTAYLIDDLLAKVETNKYLKRGIILSIVVFGLLLYKSNLQANISRSKNTGDPIVREAEEFWKLLPVDKPAFPNVVFRKPIYPILWGSTFAPYMRERYPPVHKYLEKYKLPILIGLNDEYYSYLDYESQHYIQSNYQRDSTDNRIWRRK